MKKGLSKILSLACVFALLMTMMVPAFAADPTTKIKDEEKANWVLENVGDENDTYVFVPVNSKVKLYKVTSTGESKDGSTTYSYENKAVTKEFTAGAATYFFDTQGYLQIGDSNGVLIWRDTYGDYHQYVIGVKSDKTTIDRKDATKTPALFSKFAGDAVVGKTYYAEGEAKEGRVNDNTMFQSKKDGIIELVTGIVSFDGTKDGYGTSTSDAHKEAFGFVDANDDKSLTYDEITRISGKGNSTDQVKVVLSTKKKDGKFVADKEAVYAIDKDGNVLVDDGAGNRIIQVDDGVYNLTNEDGTVIANDKESPNKAYENENVWKINGKLVDYGKDVEVKVADYMQKFYIPANAQGTKGPTYNVLTNGVRYTVLADGSDYAGLTYYNENGITYAGWVLAEGSGSSRVLKYQTVIRETGDYILVAGQQYIDAGADPEDLTKTIEAGWYLFDEAGSRVEGTGEFNMYGHKYVLSDSKIVTVDGAAPKL